MVAIVEVQRLWPSDWSRWVIVLEQIQKNKEADDRR